MISINRLYLIAVFFIAIVFNKASVTAESIHIGEGSLISLQGTSWYATVVYKGKSRMRTRIGNYMKAACNHFGDFCVGYMVHSRTRRGGLMFDISKIGSSSWPPKSPAAIKSYRITWNSKGDDWNGKGPVSLITSTKVGKGWAGWQCYAKPHLVAVTPIGEGTLIAHNSKKYYGVVQYKNVGTTVQQVKAKMLIAIIQAGPSCVGYHYYPLKGGRYLEAALLYDRSKVSSWPVKAPVVLSSAKVSWTSGSGSGWLGSGPVSLKASVSFGKGWNGWQSYAKSDYVYTNLKYIGEGTLVSNTGRKYYGVIQYKGISTNENALWSIMGRAVIECGKSCIGYHYRPVRDGQYLQAALIYDMRFVKSWPVSAPPALSSAKRVWISPRSGRWLGQGKVSNKASLAYNMGWKGWQCYAKKSVVA